jgi:hypothetical protein
LKEIDQDNVTMLADYSGELLRFFLDARSMSVAEQKNTHGSVFRRRQLSIEVVF